MRRDPVVGAILIVLRFTEYGHSTVEQLVTAVLGRETGRRCAPRPARARHETSGASVATETARAVSSQAAAVPTVGVVRKVSVRVQ
ncbi:hypothetical protein GCM10023318_35880 [Nocardia callitridis]|uniref:Secreted protein n=1 Tax=Nocardia callitridis TaxID=648753 RepID=A0ABP9KET5_9NOCA